MKASKERTPRFKQKPSSVGRLVLQDRDVEIIRLAYEYRFINSGMICALVGGSRQGLLRRLNKLFHKGFLGRPIGQMIFSNPISGPQKIVYAIGNKGADMLSEKYGMDSGKMSWERKSRRVKQPYIQHTLMISHFRTCLTLGLDRTPGTRLIFWMRENTRELRDYVYYKMGNKERRLTVVPDGFLGVEDARGLIYFFFLEADRSTMSHKRFRDKMRGYWLWWRQKKAIKRFGIDKFRVLTVTLSRKKASR